jgi:hypothetical protein
MNTSLLIEQLTMAIIASAVVVPTVQRIKGWFPSAKAVGVLSAVLAFAIGSVMALYYANYDLYASLWVGFYSLIGAEGIYMLLADKLTTFNTKKGLDLVREFEDIEGEG